MHHTQALILRKDEWGEADWLVTALSRDFGKIRLRVQGARKHGAKLQGHIEPGSLAELSFVIGRNGYRLVTARLVEHFGSVRASWPKLQALHFLLAMLDNNLLEERDGAAGLFQTVSKTLEVLSRLEDDSRLSRLITWSEVQFLDFLGLLPASQSPEAGFCSSLLRLRSLAVENMDKFEIADTDIASELWWLSNYLGEAVRLPRHIAPADYAL